MKAQFRWIASVCFAFGLAAVGSLAASSAATALEAKGEVLRIPFMQTFSGAYATYGDLMWSGALLGQDMINNELGGIKGRPIEIYQADAPLDDVASAVTMYRKLARNPNIPIILGVSATSILAAVHDMAEEFKVVHWAYDSGGVWRLPGFNKWVFRDIPMTHTAVPVLMPKMQKKFNIKTAALFYNNDDEASVANAQIYRDVAKKLGIELIEGSNKMGEPDWTAQLTKAKGGGVDAFFLSQQAFDAGQSVATARDMGMDLPALADLAAGGPDFFKMSKGRVGTTITWSFFSKDDPRPYVQNMYKAFWNKFNREPDPWELLVTDASIIMMKIMNRADDLSRESIRKAFAETTQIESILGTIGWNGSGDAINNNVITVRWSDEGTMELVPESFWN